jgi:hypothetical protein
VPVLHREACGAPGCDFVAGPSRDLNRVQRIADEHRATGHVLAIPAGEAPRRTVSMTAIALELRRERWAPRGGLTERRRALEREKGRLATARRRTDAARALADLTQAAWSQRTCPVCTSKFDAGTHGSRRTFCSRACVQKAARLRKAKPELATILTPRAEPIRHGTETGYGQHRRRGEDPCAACRKANSDASATRRRRLREAA